MDEDELKRRTKSAGAFGLIRWMTALGGGYCTPKGLSLFSPVLARPGHSNVAVHFGTYER